jgi:hypothetical protein
MILWGISKADPFWGIQTSSKPKRLRRRVFCFPNSLKQASLVWKTKNPRKFVGFDLVCGERGIVLAALGHRGTSLQKTNAGASPLIIFHCCRFGK